MTAPRALLLEPNIEYYCIVPSSDTNCAVNVTLQLGRVGYKLQAIAAALCKMLVSPAFAYFRTVKGVSYVVSIRFEKLIDVACIKFECLSNNADPIQLAAYFEEFIEKVVAKDIVGILTKEKLAVYVDTAAESLVSPFRSIKEEHKQWVHRLLNVATFEFFGHMSIAEEMKRITVGDVKQFFEEYVRRNGIHRRTLVCGEVSAQQLEKRFGSDAAFKKVKASKPLCEELLLPHLDAVNVQVIEDPYAFKYSL